MDEVMKFFRSKIADSKRSTQESLDNMREQLNKTSEFLSSNAEKTKETLYDKVNHMSDNIHDNYWSAERVKRYVDNIVEEES